MAIVFTLYQLQETEIEIESLIKALNACLKKLGENEKLTEARSKLISIHNNLEELKKKQQEIDWKIDDIEARLKKSNDDLYSGRINNPKELSNLQQDVKTMESQRKEQEDASLEIMSQIETVTAEQSAQAVYFKKLEAEWRVEHAALIDETQRLKAEIAKLKEKREAMAALIEPEILEFYNQLKAKKGLAVSKIEQGMCCGCRISLSTAELQRVRTGQVVECSSCHRILYLA
jgi:predicted  nucleic acid-binding Zn-ribbon protein